MSINMLSSKDLKTQGLVLKRTNYGEADRVLNIITPEGKIAVMAKGVRKPRSKLVGGVEMFTLAEYNIHFGRGELGILTGAKMIQHYGKIVRDLDKMEMAAGMLKRINVVAESTDSPEYFKIINEGLESLDGDGEIELIETWFLINLLRVVGEEANLYRDVNGDLLVVDKQYSWNVTEKAFYRDEMGEYGANEIKLLRLMQTSGLKVVKRVRTTPEMRNRIQDLVRVMGRNYGIMKI